MSGSIVKIGEMNTAEQKTILIVDNDRVNRVIAEKTFSQNFSVIQARDGLEALDIMEQQSVDIALFDINMTNFNGCDVLRKMHDNERLSTIPVLVLTESNSDDSQNRALDCGAQDVILKPFSPSILLKRVMNILSLQEAQRAVRINEQQRDGLTGLWNRATFAMKVKQIIMQKPADSYVITCIDIDRFKIINDRFGHQAGDDFLKYVADMRREEVHRFGGIACRDMGDIFFSLLPNDKTSLDTVTDHFFDEMKKYNLPISIDAHIGRYVIDDPNVDVNLMIDRALMAVNSIKGSAEKRTALFTDDMRNVMLREQELENDMRTALADGQFVLYFQPQYNYTTGDLTGAEALVRWNHPVKGIISPGEFIPLFEQNGFISQLDRYVWEQACKYLREWTNAGISPLPISVNISRHDIRAFDLTEVMPSLIRKYRLSAKQLHLEITESAYIDNPQELIKAVKSLRELGFIVEMDDFGAGYSSLNILKDVPVDLLKLDMKFVSESDNDSRGGSILSSVVRMAHWLKLPVIAEGVETKSQADYLKSIGCNLMQGYLFNRPMPVTEDFLTLLRSHRITDKQYKVVGTDISNAVDFFDASTQSTLLFNSFVGGAVIAEYDGHRFEMLRANDAFYEVMGCPREVFNSYMTDILPHFSEETREHLCDALEEAIRTGNETVCDLCGFFYEDVRNPVWTRNRIRFLAQNVERYVFYVSVENITESMELTEANQNLAEELICLIDSVPGGVLKTESDANGKASFISDFLLDIIGYTRQEFHELFDDCFYRVVLKEDWDKVVSLVKNNADEKLQAQKPNEYRVVTKSGELRWMYTLSHLVESFDGKKTIYTIVIDNDDRKKNEAALEAGHQKIDALIKNLPGGVITICFDGVKPYCEFFSDGFCNMLGYSHEEMHSCLTDSMVSLIHPEDLSRVNAAAQEAIAELSVFNVNYRILCKNGSYLWTDFTAKPVKGDDGVIRFYGVYNDISKCVERIESK